MQVIAVLLAAGYAAQHLFLTFQLPISVITVSLGGLISDCSTGSGGAASMREKSARLKSMLLRVLSRLAPPLKGQVLLDGEVISRLSTKEVARRLSLLPQSSQAPSGISVSELVACRRYPHQSLFGRWRDEDEAAVPQTMQATGVVDIAAQPVDQLSGG